MGKMNWGTVYKGEFKFDFEKEQRVEDGEIRCKDCDGKLKLAKKNIHIGIKEADELGGVPGMGGTFGPASASSRKGGWKLFSWTKSFGRYDTYEIKFIFKCCDCNKEYGYDEVE